MGELIWPLVIWGACSESLDWAHGRGPTLRTWRAAPAEYREWLADRLAGNGNGNGNGYGYGNGAYGYGHGYGYGAYGNGNGYGYGYGDGYGDGDGDGYGYGYGYGDRMAEDIVSVVLADGTELCGDVGDAARAVFGRLVVEEADDDDE